MKKLAFFAIATALVLGMSQCKKEQNQDQPADSGEKVTITLDVNGGKADNGAKVDVNTVNGLVDFKQGDKIHVGSGGKYVGTLEYNANSQQFSGSISNPTADEPLWFFFLGNKDAGTLDVGNTTSCTVNISDQTQELPVISMAASTDGNGNIVNYTPGNNTYSAELQNQCALVEFKLTNCSTSQNVVVSGMKTVATVDFATRSITSANTTGDITLYADPTDNTNTKKWAILLEQPATAATVKIKEGVKPVMANVHEIKCDEFHYGDGAVKIACPVFSVSATEKVHFSQGNLQYQASTDTWRFAENQWDFVGGTYSTSYGTYTVGNVGGSSNNNISGTCNGWIDLFGWGTSGWNCGNTYFRPWDFTQTTNNGHLFGPNGAYNLSGSYANSDWGVNNPISNGGNVAGLWRTLTIDEWIYVLDSRPTMSGIHFAKAVVNDVDGLILLPDNWDPTYFSLKNPDYIYWTAYFDDNIITASEWKSSFESRGAIFLPAAGSRGNNGNDFNVSKMGGLGNYWSSTCYTNQSAYQVRFQDDDGPTKGDGLNNGIKMLNRAFGISVRLVLDVN